MMTNTEFTFVRHGETALNISGKLQGQGDCPLNANGLAQADAAAEYLRSVPFDAIYASDLSRAAETARRIRDCGHEGTPLNLTRELREMNCGELDETPWIELRDHHPELMAVFYRDTAGVRFPGGESVEEFQARVGGFLEKTLEAHRGRKILLVAHGGVLQRVFRHIAGAVSKGNLMPLAGNASVNEFLYNEAHQAWQLTLWNFREHLKSLPQHNTLTL